MKINRIFAIFIVNLVMLMLVQAGEVRATSLWTDQGVSLYGNKPRSFQVGDLITVVIVEQAKATQEAKSSSEGKGSVNAGPGSGFLSKILPESFGANWGNSAEGEGSTTRGGSLQGKITVQVTGVNPNGILAIEGRQIIKVNNEDQVLKITGMVRSEDVSIDNMTLSSNIANAVIEYQGNGNINDAQKPGLLTRFFHWVF
jgi:flagellar L-ring protein precursor FlgH